MESKKMVPMNLVAGQESRRRRREQRLEDAGGGGEAGAK